MLKNCDSFDGRCPCVHCDMVGCNCAGCLDELDGFDVDTDKLCARARLYCESKKPSLEDVIAARVMRGEKT